MLCTIRALLGSWAMVAMNDRSTLSWLTGRSLSWPRLRGLHVGLPRFAQPHEQLSDDQPDPEEEHAATHPVADLLRRPGADVGRQQRTGDHQGGRGRQCGSAAAEPHPRPYDRQVEPVRGDVCGAAQRDAQQPAARQPGRNQPDCSRAADQRVGVPAGTHHISLQRPARLLRLTSVRTGSPHVPGSASGARTLSRSTRVRPSRAAALPVWPASSTEDEYAGTVSSSLGYPQMRGPCTVSS